jgi:hypothetical protein
MILWGVAMVRNEEDLIESFVRHNLAFLDGLTLLDHRSSDATSEKLAALEAEALPLVRLRTSEEALYKARHMSALARESFARSGADFVFTLDADEFINAASRAAIENALETVPAGSHALHLWRSYVPDSFDGGFGPHCLRMRLREERIPRAKVILRRTFAEQTHEMVSEGHHWVIDTRVRMRVAHHMLDPAVLCLAHCPVRSAAQLARKARTGYQARLLTSESGRVDPTLSYHWREICEDLDRGIELTEERLRLIAANYTVPRTHWMPVEHVELMEDPVDLRGTPEILRRRSSNQMS